MKIFSMGGDASVYAMDFRPHRLPERQTATKRNLARTRGGSKTSLPPAKHQEQVWWTTPCYGKIPAEERPAFVKRALTAPSTRPPIRIGSAANEANPLFPEIKPALKQCVGQMDANLERYLEFSDPNFLKGKPKTGREEEGRARSLPEDERTERRFATGYTGHVPSCVLLKRSLHTTALDPSLSLYQATQVRNNEKLENTDPAIKEKYEKMPLEKLRITHGLTYVPVEANYSNDIHNLPFGKYAF